jgi:threonyl-tRNA synthetase
MDHLTNKRHTLAHLMAAAVLELYPDTKATLGPAIDTGFYYDFDFSKPLTEDDLRKVESKMKELLPTWTAFTHQETSEADAKERYAPNPYKLELIEEIVKRGEPITLYTCGGFTDLCRGGHSENPAAEIASDSFKLDKIAGAYWRGDEKNKMLTRIYGLAFDSKAELDNHENMRLEAEKRDHRKLGKEFGLFTFSELVGSGLPLFTPKGTLIRDLIVEKIQSIQQRYGYQKVTIPHITKKDLYETSGHWDKFKDDLFHVKGASNTEFVMKPMNCPHHTQIFASEPHSYKDLPIRYAETTMVYRDEQAGELIGLSRVRSITQDDGHVFCTIDQVEQEVSNIVKVIKEFYGLLGMFKDGNYWVSLSVRDSQNLDQYLGEDANWARAESMLEEVAKAEGLMYKRVEGEAAFYGPKLDFMFKDSLGRERQLATAQLDFVMPSRFNLKYMSKEGKQETPVMIHRAIAGSLERFMAIMIEHFAGAFPLWLSPVQIALVPVKDNHTEYAQKIAAELQAHDFRIKILTDDNLGKRIREAKTEKIPYTIVIGDKEKESGQLTIEKRDGEKEELTIEKLLEKLNSEISNRQ